MKQEQLKCIVVLKCRLRLLGVSQSEFQPSSASHWQKKMSHHYSGGSSSLGIKGSMSPLSWVWVIKISMEPFAKVCLALTVSVKNKAISSTLGLKCMAVWGYLLLVYFIQSLTCPPAAGMTAPSRDQEDLRGSRTFGIWKDLCNQICMTTVCVCLVCACVYSYVFISSLQFLPLKGSQLSMEALKSSCDIDSSQASSPPVLSPDIS